MMPPPGKPTIIPANQVKPVSMLKPTVADVPKENIEQPYGVPTKPKFVSKPGGYVPSAMGGEGRVKRNSGRPAAADPFANVDSNPEPYKIPTIPSNKVAPISIQP
jgi:hypothetical protein